MTWWEKKSYKAWQQPTPRIAPPQPPSPPRPPKTPGITTTKIAPGGISSGQVQKPKGMRYERGARVGLHDAFDHEWLNDVAKYIEALEDRIEVLEKRTATPCAQCDNYAAEDDFLCHTCRAAND